VKDYEVAELFATIAAFDRREVAEVDVLAWHAAFAAAGLADLTLEDARAAVVAHYAGTRQWIMPFDVVDRCKRIRRERLRAAGDLHRFVTADPEDAVACHREFQRLHREVAAGVRNARGELVAQPGPRRLEAS
jgi:hypothetical protein